MGGYLGVMAKFGPFCRRDSWSVVRGGLRKVYYPFVHVVSTCMWVVCVAAGWVSLGWKGGCCTGGRCGGHGCGRDTGSGGRGGRSR